MAALRERHSARDGMGYADRPWLHDAFSLDAQSRSVRLFLAGGRRHAHTDTNSNSHCDGNRICNGDAYCYPGTEVYSFTEAASYAAAAAVARNWQQLPIS